MSSEDSGVKYILPDEIFQKVIYAEITWKMYIPLRDEVITFATSRKNSVTLPNYFGVLYGLL